MFGAGNSFLPQVRGLLRRGPVIPIIGDGTSLLQPIWVKDVVSCFIAALAKPDTVGRAYELGGPEAFGFEELMDLLAEAEGIDKHKVHLPAWLMRPAVSVLSRLLPSFPLTSDQLTMLLEDNVCDIREMRETFGVGPASVRDHPAE
jgi:NADH dehydrogenase